MIRFVFRHEAIGQFWRWTEWPHFARLLDIVPEPNITRLKRRSQNTAGRPGNQLLRALAVACSLASPFLLPTAPSARASEVVASAPQTQPDLKSAKAHWAFQPIRQPALPPVHDSAWVFTPVDAFVLARLEANHARPAPPASRRDWIRRVTFDLLGLPPTPAEVAAFEQDTSSSAFERVVDRLLDSPHYGERWAQHWLDVVRFAETEGFEYDRHLPGAWRFRDYVIDAFNHDKPFDRFVTEQLAGDEIDPANHELRTATIFHRLGAVRRNAGNPDIALSRNEVLTERTDIVGAAFLGLTVGCARCHNHKLEPISQKDYYRLQAYLAATEEDNLILAGPAETEAYRQKEKPIKTRLEALRKQARNATGEAKTRIERQIEEVEDELPNPLPTIPSIHNDATNRTAIHVLKRGVWEAKGEPVGPRPLGVLVSDQTTELPPDVDHPRTQLARWLVDPAHPLTARVWVNRIWQYHFRAGLVRTANDFGTHGERPTHPELLDWLASSFVQHGWRTKPIHRLIVLSNTYRQSSRPPADDSTVQVDPENRWLGRFERRRLSAEEIRDAMLAVSGRLNPRQRGPSVMVPVDEELVKQLYKPTQWQPGRALGEFDRRSVYLLAKRNLRLPFMETFDAPALQTSCARRESSTHAPQALEMLNGTLANSLAAAFAQRLEHETQGEPGAVAELAYRLALGRSPSTAERELAVAFLHDNPAREFALAMFNLNAFLYVP